MRLTDEQRIKVEENMPLVRKVINDKVRDIRSMGIFTYDDLVQIGCVGLCKAAQTDQYQNAYHSENAHSQIRARFSTYAYRLIWHEICTAVEYATLRSHREAVTAPEILQSLDAQEELKTEYTGNLEHILREIQLSATGITAKGIWAIQMMAKGYKCREIGELMHATPNNVSAWISKARKHLMRSPAIAAYLLESDDRGQQLLNKAWS